MAQQDMPDTGLNVRDFGAQGAGLNDDGLAIQKALDSGQTPITIPEGVYKIGRALQIGSNTTLRVHPQAHLFLADKAGIDQNSFLLTNKNHRRGNENIWIEGGIWDGNNRHNPRGPDKPASYTGILINFTRVTGLTIRSFTVRNPESYYIRLSQVHHFKIENINFEATHLRPNQDGIHVGGCCEDGVIRNLRALGKGVTGDDLVALSADDANHRAQNLGKQNGPIRRVCIENLAAQDCHTFVRLLSVYSPLEDVIIEGIYGGCSVSALNLDACRECRVPLFDSADPQFQDGVGHISRVVIRDVNVHKSSSLNPKALLDLRTRVRDFEVINFNRDSGRDANPQAPTVLISDFQPCRIILAGGNPEQIEITPDASVGSGDEIVVEWGEAVRLTNGGFKRLTVNG